MNDPRREHQLCLEPLVRSAHELPEDAVPPLGLADGSLVDGELSLDLPHRVAIESMPTVSSVLSGPPAQQSAPDHV